MSATKTEKCPDCGGTIQLTKHGDIAKHHHVKEFCKGSGSKPKVEPQLHVKKMEFARPCDFGERPAGSSCDFDAASYLAGYRYGKTNFFTRRHVTPKKAVCLPGATMRYLFSFETAGKVVSMTAALNAGLGAKVQVENIQIGRIIHLNWMHNKERLTLEEFVAMNTIGQLNLSVSPSEMLAIDLTNTWKHKHAVTLAIITEHAL